MGLVGQSGVNCTFLSLNKNLSGGPFLVSRTGDSGWTEIVVKASNMIPQGYHKRRSRILTAGRWPWKSETAKQCVTTDLPNSIALKMEEARRGRKYDIGLHNKERRRCWMYLFSCRRAWREKTKFSVWTGMDFSLVQILALVAITQVKSF